MARHCGTLDFELVSASGLPNVVRSFIGTQDPYCLVKCDSSRVCSKVHQGGASSPKWAERYAFTQVTKESRLVVEIYDKRRFRTDELIGSCAVDLSRVHRIRGVQEVQVPVYSMDHQQQGHLHIKMQFISLQTGVRDSHQNDQNAVLKPSNSIWVHGKTAKLNSLYTVTKTLGQGSFGTTRLCVEKATNIRFAVKTIDKRKFKQGDDITDVRREIEIMHHLKGHMNVVAITQVLEDSSYVHIVMELCAGGDLFEQITRKGKYTERDAAALIRVIVEVVAHCHRMKVMHRDIKPENFLLSVTPEGPVLKATDFGMSTFFETGKRYRELVGSPYYVAPEVLKKDYGPEADIWSCGVILYLLLCGSLPFSGSDENKVFQSILRDPITFSEDAWKKVSAAAKDCVMRMLNRDPAQRATAEQILQHEWMKVNGVAADVPLESEVVARLRTYANGNRLKKEALLVLANKLPPEQIAGLRTVFRMFDNNNDGRLSMNEFKAALNSMGSSVQDMAGLQQLMEMVDVNHDGYVDYEEFVAATINMAKAQEHASIVNMFQHFDVDGDGIITKQELLMRLKSLSPSKLADIMREVDADGDGKISLQEFSAMFQTGGLMQTASGGFMHTSSGGFGQTMSGQFSPMPHQHQQAPQQQLRGQHVGHMVRV